jgi:uncharacterized protein (DUF924 family)
MLIEPNAAAVLDFWLGPLRGVEDASDEAWRERMAKWRAGAFAAGRDDPAFRAPQQHLCDEIHRRGLEEFFADPSWATPRGRLAKIIVLDQFPRCVYRGTPLAFEYDAVVADLARRACVEDWQRYNTIERAWICVALSHAEDPAIQELSVRYAALWSETLIEESSARNRPVNAVVGASFIETAAQHAGTIAAFGRFPHRNAVFCRRHTQGEATYLAGDARPGWSFTQPPRTLYYALHAALHASGCADCRGVSMRSLRSFCEFVGFDEAVSEALEAAMLSPADRPACTYDWLYKHLTRDAESGLAAWSSTGTIQAFVQQLNAAIYLHPDCIWPPKHSKRGVPAVIDVDAMIAAQGCPYR